ncbi:MAG: choice-of-anchor J domain-containing protein [Phycisphaerales bacterium]
MLSRSAVLSLALVAGLPAQALGQASFSEPFDDLGEASWSTPGPQALMNRGWQFRNQSQPLGSHAYYAGTLPGTNPIYFNPHAGPGYLCVDGGCTDVVSGGQMSAWAVLPPVPNQIAGDGFTIWLRSLPPNERTLEVRYSPTGGTGTGSGATGVGDFTQVLINASPVPSSGWTRYQGTVPGGGRLALRFTGHQPGIGEYTAYLGIDTLSVGVPPPPPCNVPPVPNPGQSVTWTAAGGPYRLCQSITIPVGATVNIEPGVRVDIDSGHTLAIAGTLQGVGTNPSKIVIAGTTNFPPAVTIPGGTLNLRHAEFHGQVRPLSRCTVLLTDCAFPGDAYLYSDGASGGGAFTPGYIRLERCTFTSSMFTLADFLVQMKDTTFDNTLAWLLRGYADVTGGVSVSGKPLVISREEAQQPLLVSGVTATGVTVPTSNIAGPAGVVLGGGNYLLGTNSLQGNTYPLEVDGGLLPGSVVGATGNTQNAVLATGTGGLSRWANVGIPYHISGAIGDGARCTIDPGVTALGLPDAWMLAVSTGWFNLEGLPSAPITLAGVNGGSWQGFSHQHSSESLKLEHCTIRNAVFGAHVADAPALYLESCILQNNSTGANANSYGNLHIAKTRFLNNQTGASVTDTSGLNLLHFTNPNSFEGNTAAIDAFEFGSQSQANLVWWGAASGPQHPQNPGGTGDPIVGPGAGGVSIFPFLTSRPDYTDHPPVVRMQDPGRDWWRFVTPDFYFEPGQKYIVSWTATDDGSIASQRILLNPDGGYPTGFQVLADNIPATARSWEITIPGVPFAAGSGQQFLRIEATDNGGQVGWDHTACMITTERITGNVTITSPAPTQTLRAGVDPSPAPTYSGSVNFGTAEKQIYLESDGQYAAGELGLLPFVSTDTARYVVYFYNNANDQKYVIGSDYFTIRPDPRLGLVAPQMAVQTPASGASYAGSVPITWTASAAEGLYAFDIQYSLDGGKYWRLLTEDLPATARGYTWVLPPNVTANTTTRVRVIARDRRGQNSSSGADRTFTIQPGGAACYANCDSSTVAPALNVADFSCFLQRYAAGDPYANCDGSTTAPVLNVADFSCFLQRYAAGCP